jgi:hypothetical protein
MGCCNIQHKLNEDKAWHDPPPPLGQNTPPSKRSITSRPNCRLSFSAVVVDHPTAVAEHMPEQAQTHQPDWFII